MVWPTLGSRTAKEQEQELHSFNDLFSGQPLRSPVLTRAGICVPPTVIYLLYRVSRSTLTRPSGVLSCWPDGLELTPGFHPVSNEHHRLF